MITGIKRNIYINVIRQLKKQIQNKEKKQQIQSFVLSDWSHNTIYNYSLLGVNMSVSTLNYLSIYSSITSYGQGSSYYAPIFKLFIIVNTICICDIWYNTKHVHEIILLLYNTLHINRYAYMILRLTGLDSIAPCLTCFFVVWYQSKYSFCLTANWLRNTFKGFRWVLEKSTFP